MRPKVLIITVCGLAIGLIVRCTSPVAGNGTLIGNPVAAMLYNPHGSPAAHAKVKFYPRNYNPRTGGLGKAASSAVKIDSTTTDANGNYTAKLDTGTYTISASGDSGVAYQDSITVIKGDTTKPPADTLKTPGSIKGVVQLQPGDDSRTVFILFMGTHIFTTPDDAIGNFTAPDLAEGKYRVRILTTLDNYAVMDTSFSAVAGRDSVLPEPIQLRFTGIPVPKGLKIAYDTLKQIVTLVWNRPTTGTKVQGYNVYRKRSDSASFVNIKAGVTDTVYRDSTGVQDQTYEYRVAVVDTNGTEGVKSAGVSVTMGSVFILTDSIVSPLINSSQAHSFIIGKDTTIYIAMAGLNNFIRVISKTGDSINAIGENVISQVYDIVLDSKDNLFAVDPDNNMIFKFLKNGQLVSSWPINIPTAIAIDSLDNIYVVFSSGLGILKLDTAGQHIDSITLGSGTDEVHLAIAPDGRLFVGRLATNSITVYDANLAATGFFQLIAENHPLIELQGIDKNSNLYMRYVRSVQPDLEYRVFNSSGSYIAKLQPKTGGDFARIIGKRLYLMNQTGLSIYSIFF